MTQWTEHTRKNLFIQVEEINMRLNNKKKIYRSILWQYCLNEKRIAKFFFFEKNLYVEKNLYL